jgi:hypothetical protein
MQLYNIKCIKYTYFFNKYMQKIDNINSKNVYALLNVYLKLLNMKKKILIWFRFIKVTHVKHLKYYDYTVQQ